MRVFRNASIDRLMARKAEKNLQSGAFDSYLSSFLNNRNYGSYNSLNPFNTFNMFDMFNTSSNSSNPFDSLNTSGVQLNLLAMKRQMLSERIEKAVDSGEPLRGVSYSEYLTYYLDKNGSVDAKTQQLYKQDVKGDKAALRDKQWRTDKNYIIPKRLYDDPLITADRDAAIQKLAKNEKLEDWEQRLLDTVTNKKDASGSSSGK